MKNKHLILCAVLLCILCIASLGIVGVLEYDRSSIRVTATIESHGITGINGGAVRRLTLGRADDMTQDYVALGQRAPIWYTDPDNRAYVFINAVPAVSVTAKAYDMYGNETELHCAQNTIELPQKNGQFTIGVWAEDGRNTALYAFRVHIVGD